MIKIIRKQSQTDYGCPYKVYLNGVKIGEIKNGEEVGINIDRGSYTLQIKSHTFVSKELKFDIDQDEFLSFTCYPTYTESKTTKFLTKLMSGNIGIVLEKSSDFYL